MPPGAAPPSSPAESADRPGDRTAAWRASYQRVRKDLLSDDQATNRKRFALLGVDQVPRTEAILDLGAGDGNLAATFVEQGFSSVWGIEVQRELLLGRAHAARCVAASATAIPLRSGSFGAVVVMDVLHHLTQAELPRCLTEIRRLLRPGGLLFVCEPAATPTRRALTRLLMSPLSALSVFTRDKRTMVEAEWDTLAPWLEAEGGFPGQVTASGFRQELYRRFWLHAYGRFRAA